ncbi:signal peptidase I [Haloarcula sp. Atlit-7R]|uniref:signal peptidase I n=1 Tax=Haloarcula sp. Atlit-7R TaxID=2282125 RepID=UPI000EF16D96|nr:signal peptidase I [Haloarcula sp. Atlit-7R]RLN01391.1 signal peptidase I [Haloarcula sp. Atlit-7R]
MPSRYWFVRLFYRLLLFFVVVLIIGQIFDHPVLLSFVETGSMEPTLNVGDGFVSIPSFVIGPVSEGDVVVFRAEEIQGGGLTTHRIVGETDRGYITKGDANPFTDQDSGEPLVKDEQIVAVVWQPGGKVLAIPGIGTVVTGTQDVLRTVQGTLAAALGTRSLLGVQGLAYLIFALSILFYGVDTWRDSSRDRTSRERFRDTGTSAHLLIAVFTAIIVLSATAAMVGPAGSQQFGVVSAESDSPGPRVIEQGTSESVTYPIGNGGVVPVVVFLEPGSDTVGVQPRELSVQSRSVQNTTLTLSAPPETGYYRYYLTEYRYLALLPQSTIRALYQVHPWAPIVVIDAMLGIPFYLVGVSLAGSGRVRDRSRERESSFGVRLRRGIQNLYR